MNSGEDSAFPISSSSSSASIEYEGSVSMSTDSFWKIAAEVSEWSKSSKSLGSQPVRGLCISTVQLSSFCGCALGLMLDVLDIVEVEVRNREQVQEGRERRGTRNRGRRQNKETTTNAQTCDDMWMNMLYADTSCDTLSHIVLCAQG